MSVKFPLPLPFLRTKDAALFIGVSEITKLLDKVEDECGKQSAQQVLAFLSLAFTWYATRHNDFRSPFVPGMGSHGSWPKIATMHPDNVDGYTGDVWTVPASRM